MTSLGYSAPRSLPGRFTAGCHQLDTQPGPPALEPRLSQADTVVASTPDDPDPSRTLEPVQESSWVTSSLTELPLPDDTPGSPVVDPPSLPSLHPAAAGPRAGFGARPLLYARAWLLCSLELPLRFCLRSERHRAASALAGVVRALVRHITHHHTSSFVDEDTCALFLAIERVTCSTPSCGGIRRSGARVCSRCGQATQPLPPAVGDIIMGLHPCSTSLQLLPAHDRGHHAVLARHDPRQRRLCAAGKKGRSKLLLSTVPPGLGTAAEVAKRLTLWEESRFQDLLRRAEERLMILRTAGKRKKRDAQPDLLARAYGARRTAAVGAYRKATTALVSSMISFEEQRTSPGPKSSFPPPPWERKPAAKRRWNLAPNPGEDWDRPFAGLHFAALTAPCPTGARAEHVTDMLSVPRRIHANKQHAALSAVFCRISAGTLPPAARWLTRTRLCWHCKKSGKPRPINVGELLGSA